MDSLRGKTVFLTGAAGFIGANLSRTLLRRGARLHGLVKPSSSLWRLDDLRTEITLHKTDLNDAPGLEGIIRSVNPDIVIHSAFPSGHPGNPGSRRAMIETGLVGTTNLLEALDGDDVRRVVTFGSSMEYGRKDTPMSETDPLDPVSFRGAVKASQTLICRQYAQQHRLPITVLRPFMVYGRWDTPPRFIPVIILRALRGETIQLTPPGYRRDYIFAEDLVEASVRACLADLDGFEVINIASGQDHANEEVAATLQEISGRWLDVRPGTYPHRPWDSGHWVADITKAERLLGWRPAHTLVQGLEKTLAWFRRNLHMYETILTGNDPLASTNEALHGDV
jgi:nucleoside-diphosphate-sugar epimerase